MNNLDVDLWSKEEDGAVESNGLITRFTLLRSTGKKRSGRMYTYLETSSTKVSWN